MNIFFKIKCSYSMPNEAFHGYHKIKLQSFMQYKICNLVENN